MNDSTKKLGEVFIKNQLLKKNQQEVVPVEIDSDISEDGIRLNIGALPNFGKSSALSKETLGSLMKSRNYLRIEEDETGKGIILGVPSRTVAGDRIQTSDTVFD